MKTFIPRIIALVALSGSSLLAQEQDITGTWQGTLQAGRELRTVIKISKGEGGTLKGVFYSIDQGAQALSMGAITIQGSAVKMAIPVINGSYEGKLDSDGISIAGNWTQGAVPIPLNLKRANSETAWAIPSPPKAMAADANPT